MLLFATVYFDKKIGEREKILDFIELKEYNEYREKSDRLKLLLFLPVALFNICYYLKLLLFESRWF